MTLKKAVCERTNEAVFLSQGAFVADPGTGEWSFVSVQAPEEHGDYAVPVSAIVKSPEALVDWLAHLNEKTWFDPKKFIDFFTRFREANKLFQSL